MKKIASTIIGTGLFLGAVFPVFAVEGQTSCLNQTTGYKSINNCRTKVRATLNNPINNSGTVVHSIAKTVITGGNVANSNTVGSPLTIGTGGADVAVNSVAQLNTPWVTVNQTNPVVDHIGTNNVTGSESTNNVTVSNIKRITSVINNSGTVTHSVSTTLVSGNNSASNNTVGTSITSGNVTGNITVSTIMNDVVVDITQ